MLLVNTDFVTGKKIETLGIVKGSTIRAKNIGRDILSGFKNMVGGELTSYTDMINENPCRVDQRTEEKVEDDITKLHVERGDKIGDIVDRHLAHPGSVADRKPDHHPEKHRN